MPGRQICGERRHNWTCTLLVGHDGVHADRSGLDGFVYLEWAASQERSVAVVSFTEAKVGDEAYAYVDLDGVSDHYCLFDLAWFDERDGEIPLRRQRWKLIEDEPLILPGPTVVDEDLQSAPIFGAPTTYEGVEVVS